MTVWSEIPPHGSYNFNQIKHMSEEQNNEQKPLDVMAFLKADKAKFDATVGNSKPVAEKKPKKAKAEKKPKKAKAEKKPKKAKAPKVKLTPLDEMSYDDFEKLVEEHGEDGLFEMYADEIKDYGEWIWREQDRGGPTYDLRSCIRMAQEELMNGTWGPRAE